MQKCQYIFLTKLVETVNPLGINMFIRHYANKELAFTDGMATILSFVDLGPQATLSWTRDAADLLPSLMFDMGQEQFYPIQKVNVNFDEQFVEIVSNKSELDKMDLDIHMLTQLKSLAHLSSFDLCVYLNMQYYGNDVQNWNLSELKQRYHCEMDDQTFIEYIVDFSMLLIKQELDSSVVEE